MRFKPWLCLAAAFLLPAISQQSFVFANSELSGLQTQAVTTLVDPAALQGFLATHTGLSQTQKNALNAINNYSTNSVLKTKYIDQSSSDPLVILFEGAGSYAYPPLTDTLKKYEPYHVQGRFQAMAVVVKSHMIYNVFLDASTMPDQPESDSVATTKNTNSDGSLPPFNSGLHSGSYAALLLNNNGSVPATYGSKKVSKTATAIQLHKGYNQDNPSSPTSLGCLIVHKDTYGSFASTVGYINDASSVGTSYNNVNGYMIIDRSYRPW
ncbi:hypothetical protein [Gorillibacterium timonense]|uniref:hypothetical protein n=1 Tax=Gorillibacterium timonense TaxID=1689269 RepID=UPI00071D507E|nr:hypothetical protein [Gorillibacterium timonense]